MSEKAYNQRFLSKRNGKIYNFKGYQKAKYTQHDMKDKTSKKKNNRNCQEPVSEHNNVASTVDAAAADADTAVADHVCTEAAVETGLLKVTGH